MKKNNTTSVSYASAVYGKQEINAVLKVLSNPKKIVAGDAVKEFEKKVSKLFGKKFGVMVNSGSSANLIALEILDLPKGSEVITPILTFSTTLSPIIQKGLIPVFVDVKEGEYLADISQIEQAITKKTKALMIPSLLGNIPNMVKLFRLAKKHKLWLIEDSCDTIGATYNGKPTGNYSHMSTTSFYASHIVTAAGSGGMICLNDKDLLRRAIVKSYWGRESTLFGAHEKSEDIKKRFASNSKIDGKIYDAKFIFSEVGYNFQPNEIAGAFGLEQLKSLPKFSKLRKKHFAHLQKFFKKYEQYFVLPKQDKNSKTNWLAFPLTLKNSAPFSRNDITLYLEKNNIQTRPIFTGNVLKQPAYKNLKNIKTRKKGYPVANDIMKNGFVIGCHHGLVNKQLSYIEKTFTDFLRKYE